MFKRRKQKKTDYKQRLALLKSGKARLVVRRSLNNIHLQFVEYRKTGDKTLLEETSKNLRKYGWKGHCGNIPAGYLIGFLAGLEAAQKGITEAVLDIGLQNSVKGSAIYAAVLGAKESGININVSQEIAPAKDRISGKHIADYAAKLKKENPALYKKQFSGYAKSGLEPEQLPKNFEEAKNNIIEKVGKSKVTGEEQEADGQADEEEWEEVA